MAVLNRFVESSVILNVVHDGFAISSHLVRFEFTRHVATNLSKEMPLWPEIKSIDLTSKHSRAGNRNYQGSNISRKFFLNPDTKYMSKMCYGLVFPAPSIHPFSSLFDLNPEKENPNLTKLNAVILLFYIVTDRFLSSNTSYFLHFTIRYPYSYNSFYISIVRFSHQYRICIVRKKSIS